MKQIFVGFMVILLLIFSCSALLMFGNKNNNDNIDSPTQQVDFSNLTYCAFGDSITYGADYSRNYGQMDNPYSKLVAESLGLKSFDNCGVSGATLCENDLGLTNMTQVILSTTDKYDIISVMGGVNDFNRELPLGNEFDKDNSTIYGSLDMIARSLKKNNPNAFIFFMTPYKEEYAGYCFYRSNNSGYYLRDVANAIKVVAQRYNIPVLDMYNLGNFENVMYDADCDGIHPNQEFIISNTTPQIVNFIKENYKK